MCNKQDWKNKKNVRNARKWYDSYVYPEVRKINPPTNYRVTFSETFSGMMNPDVWRYGQSWGLFHPANLSQYFDTDGTYTKFTPNGLTLQLRNVPKTFHNTDVPPWDRSKVPEVFEIPTAIGILTSKIGWRYGWFDSWIQLAEGMWQWPAFWFSSLNSWPPEIDVVEGYSKVGPQYDDYTCLGFLNKKPGQKIEPTIHYGSVEEGSKESYGSYNVPVAEATRRFVQYVCHWEPDFIRIYYDGILVYEVTDPEMLKWFNDNTKNTMGVIFNAGRFDLQNTPSESEMYVKCFNVYQKPE